MKQILLLLLTFSLQNVLRAQNYIGNSWLEVQIQLAYKRQVNPSRDLYIELKDNVPEKHYYELVQLVERNAVNNDLIVLVRTLNNSKGICYSEMYPNLGSKSNALNFAKTLIKGATLRYWSSKEDGLLDIYEVEKEGKIVHNFDVRVGSTKNDPTNFKVFLADLNLAEQ